MHFLLRDKQGLPDGKIPGNSVGHHVGGLLSVLPCCLQAQPKRYYQPETEKEVEAVVKSAHEKGKATNHSCRAEGHADCNC